MSDHIVAGEILDLDTPVSIYLAMAGSYECWFGNVFVFAKLREVSVVSFVLGRMSFLE